MVGYLDNTVCMIDGSADLILIVLIIDLFSQSIAGNISTDAIHIYIINQCWGHAYVIYCYSILFGFQ